MSIDNQPNYSKMKNFILFLCLICGISTGFSQNQASDFTGNKSDQPRNPRADFMNFVPNEVLVKFNDAVPVAAGARVKAAGVSSVDQVLKAHGIASLERLFPTAQKPQKARMMKSPQGKDMTIPALDKIYRVSVPPAQSTDSMPTNIFQLIEELKALPEVEYAEPNYIYSIDDMQPVGPILTAEDVAKLQTPKQNSTSTAITPNDPLYSQQWYIPAVNADQVWNQTKGDTTQVIAILDTGVDWNHPDLKNKIWINPNLNAIPDANGVVNDIRGWDFINNDNNPMDDNSHGTHVAGIAAAETNNGIGIAGVCPKAKIMPIKVFQSSGQGDAGTITKGIIYASTHGATVINMSFGSYARSLTMEYALANAYTTCVLVASAGNNNLPIGPKKATKCGEENPGSPSYPAALPYVLGVQAPEACFTNYDLDGPTFSEYSDLLNYEMKAPGTNILSTVPNGNYRVYQGTSMAAPIVSGSVCLYKSKHPDDSQELMWGNLINSIGTYIDINSAINVVSSPKLMFVSKTLVDTLAGDNKNGLINAGETIQLWFNVRNTWGQCDSVKVGIKFGEFEDTSIAQIITSNALIGSVSPYATRTNEKNPLKIHINSNVAHNRDIVFTAYLYYPNSQDTIKQDIVFNVNNGEELSGVMDSTLILTADKLWLVNSSFRVGSNGKLIFRPGTKLELMNDIVNKGKIIACANKDSVIIIEGPSGFRGAGQYEFSWTKFNGTNNGFGYWVSDFGASYIFNHCLFENINTRISTSTTFIGIMIAGGNASISDCLIRNCDFTVLGYPSITKFERSNIDKCITDFNVFLLSTEFLPSNYNNFSGISPYSTLTSVSNTNSSNAWTSIGNNFLGAGPNVFSFYARGNTEIINVHNQYWGTTDKVKISKKIFDFWDDPNLPMVNFEPYLKSPSDSAHAIVWKILVNGKDAQDEVVDPVGVGKQRFDVYFNRSMDKAITPQVSFGVRSPYTQQSINEDGSWSEDGHIYSVYKTVKLTTGDGINRIRVANAKEINGWENEIPVEDMRFEFLINAATSSSLEFMATGGLGKVNLEWNNNNLADGLGYNMYRMENINDSTLTKPVLINKSLIADTLYTDFDVTPNKKYYYYYKIVRTDLSETDSSRVVSAIPFTASKGDANGDLSVNVLDITTIVAYLLNNNPQPFIFEAADVNSDKTINVLDIVGVVNLVLNGPQKVKGISLDQQANLYLQNDTLFADVNVPVGGIQFDMSGVSSMEDIQVLQALQGFESGYSATETGLRLLYYSISGRSVPAGTHIPLLVMKKGSKITDAIFGGTNGSPIRVNFIMTRIPDISNNMNQTVAELGQNFPNPVNGQTIIPIRIYEPVDEAVLRVVNMMGQEVGVTRLTNPYIGEHLLSWNSGTNKGLFVYTLEIRNSNQKQICPIKKMIVQ